MDRRSDLISLTTPMSCGTSRSGTIIDPPGANVTHIANKTSAKPIQFSCLIAVAMLLSIATAAQSLLGHIGGDLDASHRLIDQAENRTMPAHSGMVWWTLSLKRGSFAIPFI
ncbi:MAG: hypothetical protein V4508_08735 [Pseudomonadota bacterium]